MATGRSVTLHKPQETSLGSRIFDLQQVQARGARWACHDARRIREWEAHSGGHNNLLELFLLLLVS